MVQGLLHIDRVRQEAEQDARATVQFWILDNLIPAEVWDALDQPHEEAHDATWDMVLDVLLDEARRTAARRFAA